MKKLYLLACMSLMTWTFADTEEVGQIDYHLKVECENSDEFEALQKSIPPKDYKPTSFEQWQEYAVQELEKLIEVIKYGKVNKASINVTADKANRPSQEANAQEQKEAVAADESEVTTEEAVAAEEEALETLKEEVQEVLKEELAAVADEEPTEKPETESNTVLEA